MAFLSVFVIDGCPTTVSNLSGLYFLAETTKFSIRHFFNGNKGSKMGKAIEILNDKKIFLILQAN